VSGISDNFEKAMQKIAINTAENGGPTIQDVLTALVAKNEDDDERAERLRKEAMEAKHIASTLASVAAATAATLASDNESDHRVIIKTLDTHIVQASDFFGRVVKLEAYKDDSQRTCEGRVKKLINEEHKLVHAEYVKELNASKPAPEKNMSPLGRDYNDPADSQFLEHRESAFTGSDQSLREIIVGWRFSKWILGLVIIAVVGWVLPFWADSCSRSEYWGKTPPTIVKTVAPSPAPTISP
jgi:hypothetical protein